jgi:hypothetical protein
MSDESNQEQILNDIQSLQQMEQQLFHSLESNPNLTSEQQQKMVDKMNELSNMRINLYKTLSGVNHYFEHALSNSVGSLKQQAVAIGIVESELNKSKQRLQWLEEERNNKIRLVEINAYYGDQYEEHAQLMKIVIYTLLPVIFLGFLNTRGLLPSFVYKALLVVIALVGGYYFWVTLASIWSRDSINYQEYNWHFNPSKLPANLPAPNNSGGSSDPWFSADGLGTCVGDACCSDGLTYDTTLNQCVAPKLSHRL